MTGEDLSGPFWTAATGVLDRAGVSRSTMMGLPCLRRDGAFFAACDRRTGDLLVKLTQERVATLVAAGRAHPFAPAGRRFRRWAAVPPEDIGTWPALLAEAYDGAAETR